MNVEVRVVIGRGSEGAPADAICPEALPIAISGGGSTDGKGGPLQISAPITKGKLSAKGERPTGWRVISSEGEYTAYAICTGTGGKGEGEGEGEGETEEAEKAAAEKEAAEASANK